MAEEDLGEIPSEVPPDPYPDFWAGGEPPASTWAASDAQPANAPQRGGGVYASDSNTRPAGVEPPPQRIIHDVPPVWNGQKPETQAEPYLKLLGGWLATTRTQPKQRGMTILQYADGDLKVLINELDIHTLTSDDSGQLVYDHVKDAFEEYIDKPLPLATENCLFSADGKRRKGEGC